ncbi:hypothetical protein [Nocardia stercoris]|uniref:Uncharacterized protein n=1 Tax=Nocardia stercoris TaxID=2483361 RepID=A0A3M2L9G6_9NOCA|nr:hypothetical protein [Nocardia stercoris]RMI34241.1 hypothetical protein EBN03_07470 [Nocardia stercoris]
MERLALNDRDTVGVSVVVVMGVSGVVTTVSVVVGSTVAVAVSTGPLVSAAVMGSAAGWPPSTGAEASVLPRSGTGWSPGVSPEGVEPSAGTPEASTGVTLDESESTALRVGAEASRSPVFFVCRAGPIVSTATRTIAVTTRMAAAADC